MKDPVKMANDMWRGSKYSKKAEKAIGDKMHKMKGEDKPQKQKVAIAISEARRKGLKVPNA